MPKVKIVTPDYDRDMFEIIEEGHPEFEDYLNEPIIDMEQDEIDRFYKIHDEYYKAQGELGALLKAAEGL